MDPVVSVIIPTYNREALLPRALDSVIAQTLDDFEIVLIDDGSTDNTEAVAHRYTERLGDRFRCIRQENAGSSAARNRGIDAARGQFIAFLDSDDEYLPTKLERQLALFDLRADLGFVYGDFAYIDGNGVRHPSVFDTKGPVAREVPCETVAPGLCVCTGGLFDYLIREYFIATIVGMVRREVLADSIRFPRGLSYAEEWLFYLKVAKACSAGFVNEPLCLHHATDGSLSRTDRHRNTLRKRDLLRIMHGELQPLTRRHGLVIRANRAHTCRQLGYDAYRACRYPEATRSFAEAFASRPSMRTLLELGQAAIRSATPFLTNRDQSSQPTQESSPPVR